MNQKHEINNNVIIKGTQMCHESMALATANVLLMSQCTSHFKVLLVKSHDHNWGTANRI